VLRRLLFWLVAAVQQRLLHLRLKAQRGSGLIRNQQQLGAGHIGADLTELLHACPPAGQLAMHAQAVLLEDKHAGACHTSLNRCHARKQAVPVH
jgi:hypothetical protein